MGQVYLGILYGYQYDTHGKYNIYLCYDSITRDKTKPSDIEISNAYIYAERYEQYKYTTNTLYVDSISIGGVDFGISMSWSGHNGGDQATPRATSNSVTKTITVGIDATSSRVVVTGHRSGQYADAQRLEGAISFESGHLEYVLTLNANGGRFSGGETVLSPSPNLVYMAQNWNVVPAPLRSGYTFLGYFTDSENGIKVYAVDGNCVDSDYWNNNKQYIHAGDLNVYAHWEPVAGMAYIKQSGHYEKGLVWKKHGGSWRRGIPWAKYKGSWKRG